VQKTTELIEMRFFGADSCGSEKPCIRRGLDPHHGKDHC